MIHPEPAFSHDDGQRRRIQIPGILESGFSLERESLEVKPAVLLPGVIEDGSEASRKPAGGAQVQIAPGGKPLRPDRSIRQGPVIAEHGPAEHRGFAAARQRKLRYLPRLCQGGSARSRGGLPA